MLTPEEIEHTQFTVVRLTEAGYRQQEVDDFLERVEADYAKALSDAANMQAQLAAAQRNSTAATVQLAPVPPVEAPAPVVVNLPSNGPSLESIGLLLKTAEDAAAKIKGDAEAAALRVKVDAQNEAAGILSEVKAQAATLGAQAKSEGESLLAAAKAEADKLTTEATAKKHTIVGELESKRAELEAKLAELLGKHGNIISVLEEVLAAAKGK